MAALFVRFLRWFKDYGADMFLTWEFAAGAVCGVLAGVLGGRYKAVQGQAELVLVTELALGVALLGVALTALAILASLIDAAYLRVLQHAPGGAYAAFLPFAVTAVLGAATALFSGVGALVSPATPWFGSTITLGISTLFAVWALGATLSLVFQVVEHGVQRGQLLMAIEDAKELARQRFQQVK